jgi:hypothetical protein
VQHPPALDEAPPVPAQPQVGSVPLSAPVMMADAHPTPLLTRMAAKAQLPAQAPHSMHRSLSVSRARAAGPGCPSITNTAWGHTSAHLPQPLHFEGS